jgi:hypothetical protein
MGGCRWWTPWTELFWVDGGEEGVEEWMGR